MIAIWFMVQLDLKVCLKAVCAFLPWLLSKKPNTTSTGNYLRSPLFGGPCGLFEGCWVVWVPCRMRVWPVEVVLDLA